jgi:hypothetical protein
MEGKYFIQCVEANSYACRMKGKRKGSFKICPFSVDWILDLMLKHPTQSKHRSYFQPLKSIAHKQGEWYRVLYKYIYIFHKEKLYVKKRCLGFAKLALSISSQGNFPWILLVFLVALIGLVARAHTTIRQT